MTTTITVKANHGWPVDVAGFHPETGEKIQSYGGRVPAGATQDFICHSSMDLKIHEVQPAEIKAEQDAADAAYTAEQEAGAQDSSPEDTTG